MKSWSTRSILVVLSTVAFLACSPSRVSSEVPSVPIGPNYLSPRDTMVPLYAEWNPPWGGGEGSDGSIYQLAVSSYYQVKATERCAEALERIALALEKQQGVGGAEK